MSRAILVRLLAGAALAAATALPATLALPAAAAGSATASAHGVVLGTDRSPLQGVAVSAYRAPLLVGFGYPDPKPVASATTAADGTYTVNSLSAEPPVGLVFCYDGSRVTSAAGYAPSCTDPTDPLQTGENRLLQQVLLAPGERLKGTVRDLAGNPVAGVPVRIAGLAEKTTQTPSQVSISAANGAFSLRGVDPLAYEGAGSVGLVQRVCADGSAVTTASAPDGYAPACRPVPGGGPGATVAGLTLLAAPGGRVSGTVRGAGGTPLPGAAVSVVADHVVTTGRGGRFVLTGVPAGKRNLCVRATGILTGSATGWLDDCKPGVPVDITAMTTTRQGGTLAVAAAVTGRVTNGGGPVPRAGVGISQTVAWAAADGTYRVTGLPAGSTNVGAGGPTDGPSAYEFGSTSVTLVAGSTAAADDIALTPLSTITGVVTDQTGQPVARVPVMAFDLRLDSAPAGETETDDSGRYTMLSYYTSNQHSFSVCPLPSSLSGGGENPTGYATHTCVDVATVPSGPVTANLTVAVGGAVAGRVVDGTDGSPVGGIDLTVGGYTDHRGDPTGPDGSFQAGDLIPGSATITTNGFYQGVGHWPLGYLPQSSQTLTAKAGTVVQVPDLTVARAGGVRGRVVDAAGRPLEFARISLGGGGFDELETDANGMFRQGGLTSGEAQVCALSDQSPVCMTVHVTAGTSATNVGTLVVTGRLTAPVDHSDSQLRRPGWTAANTWPARS